MCQSVIIYLDTKEDLQNTISLQLNDIFQEYTIEAHSDREYIVELIRTLVKDGKKVPLMFIGEKIFNKYGDSFFYEIKKMVHLTNIILLSSENIINHVSKQIRNIGLYDYITKSFLNSNMLTTVTEAVKNYSMNMQIDRSYKIDSLTGLYNRNTLIKNINKSLNPTIILINIDDFKFINATHGYKNGDLILEKLAHTLRSKYGNNNVYRLISDEFVFFYEDLSADEALSFSQKIKSDIQQRDFFISENCKVNITISIAISTEKEHIIEDAQNAIHESIKHSKNCISIAKDIKKKKEKLFSLSNLQMAIDNDNVMPFYQGIRNNKTGKIDKYECLVRLKDHENKIVSPALFLELAHSVGMIPEITKLVITKAFKEFSNKECTFSINITEDDLRKNYLVDFVKVHAKRHKINLNRVVFEILENIKLESSSNVYQQISDLKALGCKIAFDDFGCEKSNFSRLLELNIDIVKIDGMFIKNIHKDPKSYKLAKAITNLAKDFDCEVIAEGVECLEAQKLVEELHIDYTQGYYYSKPEENI